ncbi:hypothetical protein DEO72_LG2g2671 [Vigna unguiculata]|uniref:Uncharacterized protein n=1 Tax=Vigna unguiculata TaxID=3917 RepID=A0A4D6L1I8_VIGUN|nr:hypothetical protein DEO72_LG2g2671 [Vigna unguiculata]
MGLVSEIKKILPLVAQKFITNWLGDTQMGLVSEIKKILPLVAQKFITNRLANTRMGLVSEIKKILPLETECYVLIDLLTVTAKKEQFYLFIHKGVRSYPYKSSYFIPFSLYKLRLRFRKDRFLTLIHQHPLPEGIASLIACSYSHRYAREQ